VLSAERAADILDALAALDAAMNGRFDPAIHLADLNQREPQLPPHLQAQFDAQRKPS
jgi:hydrogenase expression/formation protein HypC